MTIRDLTAIRRAFARYVRRYHSPAGALPALLQLKADHSERVAAEARALSVDLGWPSPDRRAAEALGLLHDAGRFSQYAEFGTFSDRLSVDHGQRGAAVAARAGWLTRLPAGERRILLAGIRHHNGLAVPARVRGRARAFTHVVRDADKLDILRLVLGALRRDGFRDLPAMLPHIAPGRTPSAPLIAEILEHRRASLTSVKSVADFLLLQLAWVYDLNYAPALERFRRRGVLPRILACLDGQAGVRAVAEQVRRHLRARPGLI